MGDALGLGLEQAEASFRRLEANHMLVFFPGTSKVWMANPLSAVPTRFWVETPRGGYWGSCVWDAFGVVTMLGGHGTVSTSCPDCASGWSSGSRASSCVRPRVLRISACPRAAGGTTSASRER